MEFLGFTVDLATLTENAISIALKVAFALLIFMIGRWLAKKIVAISNRIMLRSHLEATAANFLSRVLYGILLVIVIWLRLAKSACRLLRSLLSWAARRWRLVCH